MTNRKWRYVHELKPGTIITIMGEPHTVDRTEDQGNGLVDVITSGPLGARKTTFGRVSTVLLAAR
ncbi:hypothetical protein [Streptomyces sp. NPDC002644]